MRKKRFKRRYGRFRGRYRRRLNVRGALFVLCVCLLVCAVSIWLIDEGVKEPAKRIAMLQAENVASEIINESVEEILSSEEFDGKSLVEVETDNNGEVCAVKTDAIKINLLKSKVADVITQRMSEKTGKGISVTLGMLTGSEMLSDLGPNIKMSCSIIGTAESNIENEFVCAGYNQTLHRLMLRVEAKMYVVMSNDKSYIPLSTVFCIAETVIVGNVPDYLRS